MCGPFPTRGSSPRQDSGAHDAAGAAAGGRESAGRHCQFVEWKGRSGSDSFGREVSDPYRGFGSKGRSGSDTFRAPDAGNPDRNPGRNPGSLRARGKRTPEPQNPGRPPTPSGRSSPDSILVEQTYVTDHGQTATNDPHRSRRSATRPRGQVTATRLISATSSGSLVRSRAKPVAEAPGADHERRRRTLH